MPTSILPSKRLWRFVRRRAAAQWHQRRCRLGRTARLKTELGGGGGGSQADLAETRHQLQLTIDTIPALVVTYDPDGRCDFVDRTGKTTPGSHCRRREAREDQEKTSIRTTLSRLTARGAPRWQPDSRSRWNGAYAVRTGHIDGIPSAAYRCVTMRAR